MGFGRNGAGKEDGGGEGSVHLFSPIDESLLGGWDPFFLFDALFYAGYLFWVLAFLRQGKEVDVAILGVMGLAEMGTGVRKESGGGCGVRWCTL